jgi:hypothetical protein
MRKSKLNGFILALLFGPVGLFYSNGWAALAFVFAGFGMASTMGIFGAILVWVASIIAGPELVISHNRKVSKAERQHKELLEAIKARDS